MDIISKAIISALSNNTQNARNRKEIAKAYQTLKAAISQKYGTDSDLVDAIETLEKKPLSSARQAMLGEEIMANRVSPEIDIRTAARALLDKIKLPPPQKKSAHPFTPAVPVQRPRKPEYFTGRETELAHILALLKPHHTVALCGPAGVGKSALAAEIIWQLSADAVPEQFPDGILYHNFQVQPRVDVTLEGVARVFNEEPIPSSYEAVQRVLANRQVLLVLDGGEQADDLSGLLAISKNCGVLITSTHCPKQITEQLPVSPLPLHEAATLLRAWGKSTKKQMSEQICTLIGCSPLAIRLVGHHLTAQNLNPADYLAWLEGTPLTGMNQEQRLQECLSIVMDNSLAQLGDAAKQVLAVAGLLAMEPFDQEVIIKTLTIQPHSGLFTAIRGLFQQKPAKTQTPQIRIALRELINYGLLWREGERYRVSHSSIYNYARTQLTPPPKAIRRLATYYIALAWESSNQGLTGSAQLDANLPHYMRVMKECIKWKEWEAAHGLAAAIEDYLDRQGYLADRVTANEVGLMAAWQLGRPSEGAWLGNLGDTYRTMGHAKWAIEHFEKALNTARQSGNRHSEGNSLGNLGLAYRDLGQVDQAKEYLEQAQAIFYELRSPSAGLVHDWLKELEEMREE